MKTILFDLDGTLLPIDLKDFINAYFTQLTKCFASDAQEATTFVNRIMGATKSMLENDGTALNYDVFWKSFSTICGKDMQEQEAAFATFYQNEFHEIAKFVPKDYSVRPLLDALQAKGYTLVLATNPIFPLEASIARLSWIGASIDDFCYVTTMENSAYCKPNLKYYEDLFLKLGVQPHECLMVGNNVHEDGCVKQLGTPVFLVNDYLENEHGLDLSEFKQGSLFDLLEYV